MVKKKRPQEIDLYENFVDDNSSIDDGYTSLVSDQEIPTDQLDSLNFDDDRQVFNIGDIDSVEFQDGHEESEEDAIDEDDDLFEEDDTDASSFAHKKSRYRSYDEDDENDEDDEYEEDDEDNESDEIDEDDEDDDDDEYEDDYADYTRYENFDDFSRLGVDVSDMDDDHDAPYVSPYQKNKKRR